MSLRDLVAPLASPLARGLGRGLAGAALALPLAALVTLPLVASGLDGRARDALLAGAPVESTGARFAVLFGAALWPVLGGVLALRSGLARAGVLGAGPVVSDPALVAAARDRLATGLALLAPVVASGILVAAVKLATGRPQPESAALANEWHFLAFAPGRGWTMWPSGHTATSIAAAAGYTALRGRSGRSGLAAVWLAVVAVAAAMLLGCFHWLSDVAAGALVGLPLGWCVGSALRRSGAVVTDGHASPPDGKSG